MSQAAEASKPRTTLKYFALAAICALVFAGWSWLVFMPDSAIMRYDHQVAEYWKEHGTSKRMMYLTDFGGVATCFMVAVMGCIWQWSHGRTRLAVAWMLIVVSGAIFNHYAAKQSFDRPRPPADLRAGSIHEQDQSYPSGHSAGSAIGYGLLAFMLVPWQRRTISRIITVLLLASLVVAIAFSRVYLRAHYVSDVIAGVILGLAWLFMSMAFIHDLDPRKSAV
jgi:membrane-associated phospholipid phosphatase